MTPWYVSQAKWLALPQWSAGQAYSAGQIIRPLANFAANNNCAYECSTAGTSGSTEPTWSTNNNATTGDGTATWRNVTGQAAYGWTAPAGDTGTIFGCTGNPGNRVNTDNLGANVYVDSTQSETNMLSYSWQTVQSGRAAFPVNLISVNTAGSVPPAAADYTPGASFAFQNNAGIYTINLFGINLKNGTSGTNGGVYYLGNNNLSQWYMDCTFDLTFCAYAFLQDSFSTIQFLRCKFPCSVPYNGSYLFRSNNDGVAEVIDCTDMFGGHVFVEGTDNVPSIMPLGTGAAGSFYSRGSDYSAYAGAPNGIISWSQSEAVYAVFDECIMPPGLSDIVSPNPHTSYPGGYPNVVIQAINCDTAANNTDNNNFKISSQGDIYTSKTVYLTGGSQQNAQSISWEMIGYNPAPMPGLDCLQSWDIVVQNATIGVPVTATVQIIGTGTPITNNDLGLQVFYQGSASSPIGSTAGSVGPIPPAVTALPSSASAWTGSPGGAAQEISVTFTPQKAGTLVARLNLHSAITVYVDPTLTVA